MHFFPASSLHHHPYQIIIFLCTGLSIELSPNPAPSIFNNLAKALQQKSNIKHLSIVDAVFKKCILPKDVIVMILEASKYIESLEIDSWSHDKD